MALIIEGDMPKACNWFDENGKHRFCKVNAFCDCRTYTRGERPSDCPIIGEIPDRHGDLKDANIIMQWLNLKADNRVPVTVGEIIDFIEKQPTVLEASE